MTYFMHYLKKEEKKKKNSQLSLAEAFSYRICANRLLCIDAAA